MQINARIWAKRLDFGRNNPFDPAVNLKMGVSILQSCIKQFHWVDTSLAAYRGDSGFNQEDTGEYVDRVIRIFENTANTRVARNPAPLTSAVLEDLGKENIEAHKAGTQAMAQTTVSSAGRR
jgi:soluble lytic murein transglycosylase-like protein